MCARPTLYVCPASLPTTHSVAQAHMRHVHSDPEATPHAPVQESVWDCPRPPRLERSSRHVRVIMGGVTIADTYRVLRVLETSHPPTYYIPPEDILPGALLPEEGRASICEWKGLARYLTVRAGNHSARRAAWSYPKPTQPFAALKDHVAFYAGAMDACYVDDEPVRPQPGGFYGGWITNDVVGPFKGEPGTEPW